MTGFDLAQARYDGATPVDVPDLSDDPGTACPYGGGCDGEGVKECYLCGGVICDDHDDVADCDGDVVHTVCHRDGCASDACMADARDDALLHQQEVEDGR